MVKKRWWVKRKGKAITYRTIEILGDLSGVIGRSPDQGPGRQGAARHQHATMKKQCCNNNNNNNNDHS